MYIFNVLSAIKTMTVKELKDFIFENYYGRSGFTMAVKKIKDFLF